MPETEKEIVQDLGNILKSKGVEYKDDVIVGDSHPDLYFISPTGSTYVVEVKTWQATPQNQERARNLASLYLNTSGSAGAFVVLPGEFKSAPRAGAAVVSVHEFPALVDKLLLGKPGAEPGKPPEVRSKPDRFIFVAMPFSDKYDDTFVVAIQPAALEKGVDAVRVDHEHFAGDIVVEIRRFITNAVAVVADLSESKPNVLYETGYAEALGLPIIQICSTPLENLPFDVRNNKTLSYMIGQSAKLKQQLAKELQGIIK